MRPCRVQLSPMALRHNLTQIKAHAPSSRTWAVIKANAYGHGLLFAADILAGQADGFAVACLEEGIRLREAGFSGPVLLLEGLFSQDEVAPAKAYGFSLVVHRTEQLKWLASVDAGAPWPLWIKLDTGMHRLGFDWRDASQVARQARRWLPNACLNGLTHLACADEPQDDMTHVQRTRFEQATAGWALSRSMANSAALLRSPSTHYDWVRPGIALYGASPWFEAGKPVMRFVSELIAVRTVSAGEGVGYGLRWRARRDSRLGIVAAGYGDGYPRHAPCGTPVWVCGARVPLAGRVSMDMLCVDLTDHPESAAISPGAPVELWGEHVPVMEVAEHANTISYELLCGITERVRREHAKTG